MKAYILGALLLCGVVIAGASATAHHSFTAFWYVDREVEITGIVKSVKLVNPHSEMLVEVTEGMTNSVPAVAPAEPAAAPVADPIAQFAAAPMAPEPPVANIAADGQPPATPAPEWPVAIFSCTK